MVSLVLSATCHKAKALRERSRQRWDFPAVFGGRGKGGRGRRSSLHSRASRIIAMVASPSFNSLATAPSGLPSKFVPGEGGLASPGSRLDQPRCPRPPGGRVEPPPDPPAAEEPAGFVELALPDCPVPRRRGRRGATLPSLPAAPLPPGETPPPRPAPRCRCVAWYSLFRVSR